MENFQSFVLRIHVRPLNNEDVLEFLITIQNKLFIRLSVRAEGTIGIRKAGRAAVAADARQADVVRQYEDDVGFIRGPGRIGGMERG